MCSGWWSVGRVWLHPGTEQPGKRNKQYPNTNPSFCNETSWNSASTSDRNGWCCPSCPLLLLVLCVYLWKSAGHLSPSRLTVIISTVWILQHHQSLLVHFKEMVLNISICDSASYSWVTHEPLVRLFWNELQYFVKGDVNLPCTCLKSRGFFSTTLKFLSEVHTTTACTSLQYNRCFICYCKLTTISFVCLPSDSPTSTPFFWQSWGWQGGLVLQLHTSCWLCSRAGLWGSTPRATYTTLGTSGTAACGRGWKTEHCFITGMWELFLHESFVGMSSSWMLKGT